MMSLFKIKAVFPFCTMLLAFLLMPQYLHAAPKIGISSSFGAASGSARSGATAARVSAHGTAGASSYAASSQRRAFESQISSNSHPPVHNAALSSLDMEANRRNLAIQSHIQQQLSRARKNLSPAPVSFNKGFNGASNPGLIYRRTGPNDRYIGQTGSLQRYLARQAEHNRKLGMTGKNGAPAKPRYELVGGSPTGYGKAMDAKLKRVAEQAAINAEKRYGATLSNKVRAMSQKKYAQATSQ